MSTIDWANAVSGTFTTAADWSGGVVPGPGDTALIAVFGPAYTVTVDTSVALAGLDIDQARATVLDTGTITAGNIALQSGTLLLDRGTLAGTLTETGGVLKVEGKAASTLTGMTFQGNVTVAAKSRHVFSTVTISNGLTLTGQGGTGPGEATFNTAALLQGTPVLDNGTLTFNGGGYGPNSLYALSFKGSSLTFGAHLVATVGDVAVEKGQTLTNDGLFSIVRINDLTQTASGTFVNNGTLVDQILENAASFTNNGTIDEPYNEVVLNAAGLQHAGANGVIDLSLGGQIDIAGNLTTAQFLADLATQNVSGSGTFGFGVFGTLDNSSATLTVGLKTAYGALGNGIFDGGTIIDRGNGDLVSQPNQSQTLENLTYETSHSTISLIANLDNTVVTGANAIDFYASESGNATLTGGTLSGVGNIGGALILNGVDITGVGGDGGVQVNIDKLEVTAAQDTTGYTFTAAAQSETLVLDAGVTLNGATIDVGADAALRISGSGAVVGAALVNNGEIDLVTYNNNNNFALSGAIGGTGAIVLDSTGLTLSLSTAVPSQTIEFLAGTQTLAFITPQDASGFGGTLSDFNVGDAIVLGGDTVSSARFADTSIIATLSNGATISLATSSALSGIIEVSNGDTLVYQASAPKLDTADVRGGYDEPVYGGKSFFSAAHWGDALGPFGGIIASHGLI